MCSITKNSIILAVYLLLLSGLLAQPSPQKNIFIETNILPSEEGYHCFISYRIPYNLLIFVKNGNGYHSGAELMIEVKDSEDVVRNRESDVSEISISDYELTNSRSHYLEGIISIDIEEGKYFLFPELILNNTKRSGRLPKIPLEVTSANSSITNPIIVYSDPVDCGDNSRIRIANFENSIPYSLEEFALAVFIKGDESNELNIGIFQNGDTLYSEVINDFTPINLSMKKCGGYVVLSDEEKFQKGNLFVARGFSHMLNEGVCEIEISSGELSEKISVNVVWPDKPFSLLNPEFAIRLLENIVPVEDAELLLDSKSEMYYENLVKYWSKKDTRKETSFNELMNEFYTRADYAVMNFASVNKGNGAESDRGRIYLKFGKPDRIERLYPEQNQILEIWYYDRLDKKFVFKDTEGLGNYYLVN